MAEATYSSAPFISKDVGPGGPTDRAEVKVVTGYGNIFDLELSDKGKSVNVFFKVDNTKYKSSGWAPAGGNVVTKVEEAKAAGVPIYFRIEVRRKDTVDRTESIKDLSSLAKAKDNVVKSLAAVKIEGEEEWTISPHAKTRLEEDVFFGGASSAGGSAYDYSLEDLGHGNKPKESSADVTPSNWHPGIEAAPYSTLNKDGSLNVGSFAVAVPLNLFSFVVEYERTHEDAVGPLTDKQRILLAKVLMSAANELQLAVYDGKLENPDMSAGSHTRARAIIFEIIRTFYPLTGEIAGDKALMKEWRSNIVEKSLGMWRWGISEVEKVL
jgi:hypothetical protein